MRKKRILLLLLAMTFSSSMLANVSFAQEQAAETLLPAAVSGYVSSDNGELTLADKNKTPVIYVDSKENEAVIRAAGDLSTDIEKVTGKQPKTVNAVGESNFTYADGKITMKAGDKYEGEGTGIMAVYKQDGTLDQIAIADHTSSNGTFLFSDVVAIPGERKLKGFVWDSLEGMNPLTDTIYQSSDLSQIDVVVGTVGEGGVVDMLAASGKIDVSEIDGKWESFKTQVVDDTLLIAGSDRRGTIYGVYDLSEKMGVSPWYWWADVPVGHADSLYVNLNEPYVKSEPSVKYRGIFINDEQSLKDYAFEKADTDYTQLYPRVYELLLRLGANYLWPAMHEYSPAFHQNPLNAKNADRYGIIMGSSHCEMFLRNNLGEFVDFQKKWEEEHRDKVLYNKLLDSGKTRCAYVWTSVDPDTNEPVDNKELLLDYWREVLVEYGAYENIYNVGMRGMHDEEWQPVGASTNKEKARMLEEIITEQRKMIEEVLGKNAEEVPQMFVPYKELQPIYDSGMDLPDDVTIMWTDDNFGNIRQLPTEETYQHPGGAGIYYHLSYHGAPKSQLWLSTTPMAQIREQMTKAYDSYARQVWVVNVGDIKPAENDLEYFMDLANDVSNIRNMDLREYRAAKAKRDFGFDDAKAAEYADIEQGFDMLSAARKPDMFSSGLFAYEAYGDEGQQYIDRYEALTKRSETLYEGLDAGLKPAFYELQLYPLRSSYNQAKSFVGADKAKLYATEGRGSAANKYFRINKEAKEQLSADNTEYNTMLDKKWYKIMDPFFEWWGTSFGTMGRAPQASASEETDIKHTNMGIASEDMKFSGYSKDIRFIDIYNTGGGSFDWNVSADQDWIKFSKQSGTVYSDDRIWAGVDWEAVPEGDTAAVITVNRLAGSTVVDQEKIPVTVKNTTVELDEKTYAEANGYVSVEAEHYTSAVANGVYSWETEMERGRSGDALKAYPNFAMGIENPNMEDSAYTEYKIYFESTGTFDVDIYRMPTLNERGETSFAIGMDEAVPTVLKGVNKWTGGKANASWTDGTDGWSNGVYANNQTLNTTVTVSTPGYHTLRLYSIDTGVIIDKIVITTTGEKQQSYFGAPESYNSTFNNKAPAFPAAKTVEMIAVEGNYNPDVITATASIDGSTLNGVQFVKAGTKNETAKAAAVAYRADGAMTGCKTVDIALSDKALDEAFDVAFDLDLSNAVKVDVIVYDNDAKLQVLAPAKSFAISDETTEAADTIAFNKSVSNYIGRQSMVRVTSDDGALVYMGQEEIAVGSYKTIPLLDKSAEYYTIKVGIYGEQNVLEKKVYTAENYIPSEGVTLPVYTQSFGADISGDQNIIVSGTAGYDSTNGNIKMNSGTVTVIPEGNVGMVQGRKLCVESDIAYGKLSGKYMTYKILDSKGREIMVSKLSAYGTGAQSLKINGEEKLSDGKLPASLTAENNAMTAKYTHYKTVIDPVGGTVAVMVTNEKNDKVKVYYGALGADVKDIGSIVFSSDYGTADRSCYVDNVVLSAETDPRFQMVISAEDKNGEVIEPADIRVTDALYGTLISPEVDGTYMLCEGSYQYAVSYNGEEQAGSFDVFSAMQTNEIVVPYDIEYTNNFKVNVSTQDDTENSSQELCSWDFIENQTGEGKNVPVLSGGAYYDESRGAVSLSASAAGGLTVNFENAIKTENTHKAVIEFDMGFAKLSKKSSGYAITDTAGNKIVDFSLNEYNNDSSNQKLEIGGKNTAAGNEIMNCVAVTSGNGMTAGLTHFKNEIDFATGAVTVTVSSKNGVGIFKGTMLNINDGIAALALTSNHTDPGRNTYVDNISVRLEAVPVKRVIFEAEYLEEPVTAEITVIDVDTGISIPYAAEGILLRAGDYRYTATYGENKISGSFSVIS